MKRIFVIFLVFGLLFTGVSPTLAAGEHLSAAAPSREEVASSVAPKGSALDLVVPQGDPLGNQELDEVEGKAWWAVAGAIVGAYTAVRECHSCALSGKVTAGFVGAVMGATVSAYAEAAATVASLSRAAATALSTLAQIGSYETGRVIGSAMNKAFSGNR